MNYEDYLTAKAIIIKCLKSKVDKQPFDFKKWEFLDYEARRQALLDMTCPLCHKIRLLTRTWSHLFGTEYACEDCSETWSHLFGTEYACEDCSDEKNYPSWYEDGSEVAEALGY